MMGMTMLLLNLEFITGCKKCLEKHVKVCFMVFLLHWVFNHNSLLNHCNQMSFLKLITHFYVREKQCSIWGFTVPTLWYFIKNMLQVSNPARFHSTDVSRSLIICFIWPSDSIRVTIYCFYVLLGCTSPLETTPKTSKTAISSGRDTR